MGVIKQLWEIWCSVRIISPSNIRHINQLLLKITPPKELHRQPRPFSAKCKWKGSEWQSWLLFYCLPCLQDILPSEHVQNLSLLVRSIFILLKKSITEAELYQCEEDLLTFVIRCQELYSEKFMTFNVHSLLHLVNCVRMSGPLWASSTFPFESAIFQFKQQITGPRGLYDQIAKRTLRKISFKLTLKKKIHQSETCLRFCESLFSIICSPKIQYIERAVLLGKLETLENGDILYERYVYKHIVYDSLRYSRSTKTNNVIALLTSNTIVEIKVFICAGNKSFAQVEILETETGDNSLNVQHIFRITRKSKTQIIPIEELKEKMIYMNLKKFEYVSRLPNKFYVQ